MKTKIALFNTTIKALDKSIEHWEKNLSHAMDENNHWITLGSTYCALCALFIRDEDSCVKCPIVLFDQDAKGCHNTPYYDVVDAVDDNNDNVIDLIKKEIDHLVTVRAWFLENYE